MPKANSQADVMTDWAELLDALKSRPDLQPVLEAESQALAQSLAEVQGLKARQNETTALRQEATQKLNDAVAKGKDTATAIRSVLRGKIGPKSELLVHFKIAPLRKRPRKPGQTTVKKPGGGAPGSAPGSSATPSSEGAA